MKKYKAAINVETAIFFTVEANDEEEARTKILEGSDDVVYLGEEPTLNQHQQIAWIEEVE
mgnify:FL=1